MRRSYARSRYNEYLNDLTPLSEMCVNCIYFVRHYVPFEKDHFVPIDHGHCKNGRLKTRQAFDICENFANKYYDD